MSSPLIQSVMYFRNCSNSYSSHSSSLSKKLSQCPCFSSAFRRSSVRKNLHTSFSACWTNFHSPDNNSFGVTSSTSIIFSNVSKVGQFTPRSILERLCILIPMASASSCCFIFLCFLMVCMFSPKKFIFFVSCSITSYIFSFPGFFVPL